MDATPETQWARLQPEHPPASKPKGLYKPVVIVGNLAYTSGHLPVLPNGSIRQGRIGATWTRPAASRPPGGRGWRCWRVFARRWGAWTKCAA